MSKLPEWFLLRKPDSYISITDMREITGKSDTTIRAWIKKGILPKPNNIDATYKCGTTIHSNKKMWKVKEIRPILVSILGEQ